MFVLWANSSSFLFFAAKGVQFLYSLGGRYGSVLLTLPRRETSPKKKMAFLADLMGFVLTKGKASLAEVGMGFYQNLSTPNNFRNFRKS